MLDFANFLCCFNNQRIYCLEYECLIISILIFFCNFLGLLVFSWDILSFSCEVIYVLNLPIIIFSIFIISFVIYSTLKGRVTTHEVYKSFSCISLFTSIIYLYLFIIYIISLVQIIKDYSAYLNQNDSDSYSSTEKKTLKNLGNSESRRIWIFISLSCMVPLILSFTNVLLWISIFLRIYYKIYCSFKKEIRKELRKNKNDDKKQFTELKEDSCKNTNIKGISIVIEKDRRHPGMAKMVENGTVNKAKKITGDRTRLRNIKVEYNQLNVNSLEKSERNDKVPEKSSEKMPGI